MEGGSSKGYGAVANEPPPFEAVKQSSQDKDWQPDVRRSFLVKMYSIVTVQLAFTVLFCGLSMYVESVKLAVMGGGFLALILCIALLFIFMIALSFNKHSYPLNMWLLGGFTVAESFLLGMVCAGYQTAGEHCAERGILSCAGVGATVWYAWAATFVVFLSLTAFVALSGYDFKFLDLFLLAGSIVLIVWGLVNMIFGLHGSFLYGACGAVLMCGYILYDTSNIMKRMGPDDYAVAAVEIYMDVVTLFLYILQMFGDRT